MRSPWKRVPWTRAAVAVATAAVSALPLISGCKSDVERADEKVSADMDTAHLAMASAHPEAAREALAKTTDTKGASPEAQIESHLLAAQADLDAANLLISGPAPSSSSAISFRAIVEGKTASQSGTQTLTNDERTNLVGIEQRQIRIAQLLSSMAAVGQQLALTNINVAGYKALDPAQARAALQKATSDAEKGDKGVWVAGTAPLASLEGLKAREQELQKQIADLTGQRNDLNSKRGQALQDAGKFSQQSDSSSGTESVGFFTQAANQRKDAADAEVKIAQLDAQLAPLQQDLGLVQVQEKAIGEIVAGYGAQSQQVEAAWKDVQNRIDQASALAKDLLSKAEQPGAGAATAPAAPDLTGATPAAAPVVSVQTTPHSLVGLAAELDAQEKEVQSLRARAVTLLNSATKHYDQALGIANTLTKTLTALSTGSDAAKLPERRAWQDLIALNGPAVFKLRQAEVQGILARLYSDQFAELSQRNRVAAQVTGALKQAGVAPPQSGGTALIADAPVSDDLVKALQGYEGDLKQEQPPFEKDAPELALKADSEISPNAKQAIAAVQADMAFHWAASLLDDVIKNPGQGDSGQVLGNIGHAALMATDYAESQFAMLQGKDQESSAQMKEALSERQALADANAQNLLPSALPAGLAFEVKPIAPTTAPGVPSPSGPGTPGPGTPTPSNVASGPDQQEVVRITGEFYDDLAANQVDKATALITPFPQAADALQVMADAMNGITAFKASVKAKFGDASNASPIPLPELKPDMTKLQVAITGNKAKVTSPTNPDVLDMTKGDGGWKIDPPSAQDLQGLQMFKSLAGVIKAEVPDIDAGKFATVGDLAKDMADKFKAAGMPMPAGSGATTAPAAGTTPPPETTTGPATAPAAGTTPPPEGTTPPATAPAPAGGTTPPAQ